MKSAFAKLLEKNPTESSTVAFRAGGNGVPILTRAASQSTTGYQTMGLPNGSKPMPGGGANKTSLGAARYGDNDGNAPPSAGFNSYDIFTVPGQPGREYPERTFASTGNNVFQPENNDLATHALLKRLGDQKFKAEANAPFEEYRAQQRQAKDLEEASRNASLSDLGTSREIIRNLAAQRRQQNEDDYLRKMLDAGATPEAARKEIEDVRNANAIQEAKKVDDRQYQAKMLIQRMASARGVTPMVREPLNQSSSIDNPQRSQAMSQAMGMPGEGFGTSPLDMNRQFMTPDFYRKYLRKSNMTQESADEATAFGQLITGSGAQDAIPPPSSGAFSMATLKGQERQQQVEIAAEGLASRLETLRARGNRILTPLPENIIAKKILNKLYDSKKKKKGDKVLTSLETIQDMNWLQLILATNLAVINGGVKAFERVQVAVKQQDFGTREAPTPDAINKMRIIALRANNNESNISIPFASTNVLPMSQKDFQTSIYDMLDDIKAGKVGSVGQEIKKARTEMAEQSDMTVQAEPIQPAPVSEVVGGSGGVRESRRAGGRGGRNSRRNRRRGGPVSNSEQLPEGMPEGMAEAPVPGAPGR